MIAQNGNEARSTEPDAGEASIILAIDGRLPLWASDAAWFILGTVCGAGVGMGAWSALGVSAVSDSLAAGIGGGAGAVGAMIVPKPVYVNGIAITDDGFLHARDSRGRFGSIPVNRVLAVSGLPGLQFQDEDIWGPKWVEVQTTEGVFQLSLPCMTAIAVAKDLAQLMPWVIFVPFDGPVSIDPQLPARHREMVGIALLERLGKRSRRLQSVGAAGILACCAIGIIGLNAASAWMPRPGGPWVQLCVLAFFGIPFFAVSWRRGNAMGQRMKEIRELTRPPEAADE